MRGNKDVAIWIKKKKLRHLKRGITENCDLKRGKQGNVPFEEGKNDQKLPNLKRAKSDRP